MLCARIVACVVMVGALNACQGVSKIDQVTLTAPSVQVMQDAPVLAEQGASTAIASIVATAQPPTESSVPHISELAPERASPTSGPSALPTHTTNPVAVSVEATPGVVAPVSPPAAKTISLPHMAQVGRLVYIQQTLNNCGPASVAEVLRFWGISRTQEQVQSVLRADGNPRGMVPYGVPSYMQSLDMRVLMGVNGDEILIKDLIASGFPVIVSQWVSETDHIGHYRPIEAFDDGRGGFIASDPYLGPDHFISYDEFDQIWATNSRRFIVVYPTAKQQLLQSVIVSAGWDKTAAYQADLAKLRRRLDLWQSDMGRGASQQRFGSLAIAWDEIELGQIDAATAAVHEAQSSGANPIVVGWIVQALATSRG